jgi:hypothetical protein
VAATARSSQGPYSGITLMYKPPKDSNRDWSPRFSTLRDKNG